jgi:predicted ATP-grasp superfamily ATP-dependent carboligase
MQAKQLNPAVVLGMSANGLSIARSLGRKGIPVIGLDSNAKNPGMYSSYCEHYVCPNVSNQKDTFFDFMINVGKKLRYKGILFVTADEYIQAVSERRKELSPYFEFNFPSHDLVESFLDKEKTYKLAERLGILYPKTYSIQNGASLSSVCHDIKYPCIIKPRFSHVWREIYGERKVFIITSPSMLSEYLNKIQGDNLGIIIQEIVPGKDSDIYQFLAYANPESTLLAYFCARKLRQYPPHFGISCLTESVNDPEVIEMGNKVLKDLDFKGTISIEIKKDPYTKKLFFLEANLRTIFFGELCVASGLDFPYIIYRNLAYKDNTIRNGSYTKGVKLINIELDLGSYLRYRSNKELRFIDWLKSYKTRKIAHTYLAFDDLKPFLVIYTRLSLLLIKIIIENFKKRIRNW